jgi:hypothetical protein
MQAGATEDDDASFEMRSAAVERWLRPERGRSGRLGGCTMLVLRETT